MKKPLPTIPAGASEAAYRLLRWFDEDDPTLNPNDKERFVDIRNKITLLLKDRNLESAWNAIGKIIERQPNTKDAWDKFIEHLDKWVLLNFDHQRKIKVDISELLNNISSTSEKLASLLEQLDSQKAPELFSLSEDIFEGRYGGIFVKQLSSIAQISKRAVVKFDAQTEAALSKAKPSALDAKAKIRAWVAFLNTTYSVDDFDQPTRKAISLFLTALINHASEKTHKSDTSTDAVTRILKSDWPHLIK